jgi:hypothetical protein
MLNVTAFYRQRIDEVIDDDSLLLRTSSGETSVAFRPEPSRTFNRGFTSYFIKGRAKDILSIQTPKSTGAYLGRVIRSARGCIELDTQETVRAGDGICCFDGQNILWGSYVNRVEGNKIHLAEDGEATEGAAVYRNYDHDFSKRLQSGKTERRIRIRLAFNETETGFALVAVDEDGNSAQASLLSPKVPSRKNEAAPDAIRRQLTRLGDSIFACTRLTVNTKGARFVPPRELNSLRRRVIGELEAERKRNYKRELAEIAPNAEAYGAAALDFIANVSNSKAESFYRRHGVRSIEPAFELQKKKDGKIVMTTKLCLRYQFGMCRGRNISDAPQLFLRDSRNTFRLDFDCRACEMKIILLRSSPFRRRDK